MVALLGILGAALIFGGIIAYRGSETLKGKVLSAAMIGAGAAMLLIIGAIVPVFITTTPG